MEEALRARLKNGDFDKLDAAPAFAQAVSKTLSRGEQGRAYRLRLQSRAGRGHPAPRWARARRRRRRSASAGSSNARRNNFGFRKVERLAGNIGYLDFRGFASPDQAGATAIAAMNFLAYCDAIIVDLRQNGGGDPAQIQLISSYFFDEPVHLNDLYARAKDTTENYWTLPYVPGPKAAGADLYILTSARTFSGAEEFTYNMKNLKRATVIGETTGGGAHPTGTRIVQTDFILRVPFARAINPVSKTNWEGTGVAPDIAVPGRGSLRQGLRDGRREARRQGDRSADQGRVRVDPGRGEGQEEPAAGRREDAEDLRRRLRRAQGHLRERRPVLSADGPEIPARPHDRDAVRRSRASITSGSSSWSRTGRRSSSSAFTTTASVSPRRGRNSRRGRRAPGRRRPSPPRPRRPRCSGGTRT